MGRWSAFCCGNESDERSLFGRATNATRAALGAEDGATTRVRKIAECESPLLPLTCLPVNPTEPNGTTCLTCYGQGEISSEMGLGACPDCGGTGSLPPRDVLVEWRLRAIEKSYTQSQSEASSDVAWLAFELRQARDALVKIMALAQDEARVADLRRIRFWANDALGVYEARDATTILEQSSEDEP